MVGGIAGSYIAKIENCRNYGTINNSITQTTAGGILGWQREVTLKSESEIKSQTFVDLLNSNIGTNTDWKKWKLGSNGYPTFLD